MSEEDIDRMGAEAARQGLEKGWKRSKTDAAELIRAIELCTSEPDRIQCMAQCPFDCGDISQCIPRLGKAVAERLREMTGDIKLLRKASAFVHDGLFLCDPEKNTECPKTSCQKDCFHTVRKEFSADPEDNDASIDALLTALCRMKVELGSLVCLGCGYEHQCSTKGCAIIRAAELSLRTLRGALQSMVHSYLQEMERVPWWRDVRDELPEPDELVLVIVSGKPMENLELIHAVQLAEFSKADGWILMEYPEWTGAEVSH